MVEWYLCTLTCQDPEGQPNMPGCPTVLLPACLLVTLEEVLCSVAVPGREGAEFYKHEVSVNEGRILVYKVLRPSYGVSCSQAASCDASDVSILVV